ncbi:MAG: ankyrin repeat domain-containing protein [Gammaproteobacteria bacterium]|nr:ankyrin repeat domain-containing protein [Gammaproteobacteria bacterium]
MKEIEQIYKEVETTPDFTGHKITSINYTNGYGDTPLHIVANWGDCEAIQVLVSAGSNINAIGESGFTPLHCAAEQNKPEAIKLLIQLGASTDISADSQTPLELALSLNNNEAVNAFS